MILIGVGVALAAGAGAAIRFIVGGYLNGDFPVGTLLVNLAGSFLLGLVVAADDPVPVIVGVGALGAMSTWSTAAVEAAAMARRGEGALAAGYLWLSVTSGIVAAWIGLQLGVAVF